jgi:hypothetical protein
MNTFNDTTKMSEQALLENNQKIRETGMKQAETKHKRSYLQ